MEFRDGWYYDRDGKRLTLLQWAKLLENFDYRRVAKETLEDGTLVSTVWIGLDYNLGCGKPAIFETMAFSKTGEELDMDRYSTEAEALRGHKKMVMRLRTKARTA